MTHQLPPTPLQQALQELAAQFGLVGIYAFGSQATAVYQHISTGRPAPLSPGSDVDIGVHPGGGRQLDPRQKVQLAQQLEELLGVARVDLVLLPEADPFLAANIIRGERLFVADTYLADEYELYVLRRVGDLAHFERERLRRILEGESA